MLISYNKFIKYKANNTIKKEFYPCKLEEAEATTSAADWLLLVLDLYKNYFSHLKKYHNQFNQLFTTQKGHTLRFGEFSFVFSLSFFYFIYNNE